MKWYCAHSVQTPRKCVRQMSISDPQATNVWPLSWLCLLRGHSSYPAHHIFTPVSSQVLKFLKLFPTLGPLHFFFPMPRVDSSFFKPQFSFHFLREVLPDPSSYVKVLPTPCPSFSSLPSALLKVLSGTSEGHQDTFQVSKRSKLVAWQK